MKRCPACNRTFTDPNLSFCIDDGTPLVNSAVDDETTVVSPSPKDQGSDQGYKPRDWQTPAYQPPGYQTYPDTKSKRKTWPWVVGIFALVILVFGGLGIAAAIMFPKLLRTTTNRNSNANLPVAASRTPDLSTEPLPTPTVRDNSDDNENANSDTLPPTDETKVLADLTNLEHDWTVANINADKEALDRILADDYVGVLPNGRNQGKAEYLATIKRDDSVQRWDFKNLKVTLNNDRASLTGVVQLEYDGGVAALQFTDKFVWRDGRWQAVSSEVEEIK